MILLRKMDPLQSSLLGKGSGLGKEKPWCSSANASFQATWMYLYM